MDTNTFHETSFLCYGVINPQNAIKYLQHTIFYNVILALRNQIRLDNSRESSADDSREMSSLI